MLLVFVTFLHIGTLSLFYGILIKKLFEQLFHQYNRPEEGSVLMLAGLVILTIGAEFWSLFFHINAEILGIVSAIPVIAGIRYGKMFKRIFVYEIRWPRKKSLWFIVPALVIALAYGAIPSLMGDDRLYYMQFIKWLNTYGVVPGLGNLHGRLAYNSAWHTLSALFSYPWFTNIRFNDVNAFLYILFALFAFYPAFRSRSEHVNYSRIFRIVAFWGTLFLIKRLSAPAADMVVAVIVWIIVALVWEMFEKTEKNTPFRFFLISVLAVFLVTVKLSAFPILFIPLILLIYRFTFKRIGIVFITGIIVIFPWILQNYHLSGYFAYPVPQSPEFSVDWSIPQQHVSNEQLMITSWAKVKAFPAYGFTAEEISKMSPSEWFPYWLDIRNQPNKLFYLEKLVPKILCFTGIIAFFVCTGIYLYRWLWRGKSNPGVFISLLLSFVGIVFWFFTAPDVRFGMAWLLIPVFLLLSWFLNYIYTLQRKIIVAGCIGLFLLQTSLWGLFFYYSVPSIQGNLDYWYPEAPLIISPAKALTPEWKTTTINNVSIHLPEKSGCGNAPLPCTQSSRVNKAIELRKNGLEDGFRVKNKTVVIPAFENAH